VRYLFTLLVSSPGTKPDLLGMLCVIFLRLLTQTETLARIRFLWRISRLF
jgi:hypothetical protein